MQSTGQASTQAASLVPMQGSAITYAIAVVGLRHLGVPQPGWKYNPRGLLPGHSGDRVIDLICGVVRQRTGCRIADFWASYPDSFRLSEKGEWDEAHVCSIHWRGRRAGC